MNLLCKLGIHDWNPMKYLRTVAYYDLDSSKDIPSYYTRLYEKQCKHCGEIKLVKLRQ
jgi:hypothetical protein